MRGREPDDIDRRIIRHLQEDGRRPYTVIARATHIHPTVTELIPTVLQGLAPLE